MCAMNAGRSLGDAFWDRHRGATGFVRSEVVNLRESDASDRDVTESVELVDDTQWAGSSTSAAVASLRSDLQAYITVLRALKADNAKRNASKLKVRTHIEESRYRTLRERESQHRLTPQTIADRFEALYLPESGITTLLSQDAFANLKELRVQRNQITELCGADVPANLRLLVASSNAITRVDFSDRPHEHLICVGLSNNAMEDVAFLLQLPALAVADLSYNAIGDLPRVASLLSRHAALEEIDLRGNPICFEEGYRRRVCAVCPNITVLDGVPVADSDRVAPTGANDDGTFGQERAAAAALAITGFREFALLLNTGAIADGEDVAQQGLGAAGKSGKGGAAAGGKAGAAAAGKGAAAAAGAPGGKGGKGGADDAGGNQVPSSTSIVKRQLQLTACATGGAPWCGATIQLDDVEAAVAALAEIDGAADAAANAASGGKGGKVGGKGAAPAVKIAAQPTAAISSVDAAASTGGQPPAAANPAVDGPAIARVAWQLPPPRGVSAKIANDLLQPLVVEIKATDTKTTTTGSSGPTAPDAGTAREPVVTASKTVTTVGRCVFDLSAVAADPVLAAPEPTRVSLTAQLELDPVTVAMRKYAVAKQKARVKELQQIDAALDKDLADLIRSITPAAAVEADANARSAVGGPPAAGKKPAAPAGPASPAKPPAGGGKAAAASNAASTSPAIPPAMLEEVNAKRDESAGRKLAIEEAVTKLAAEERALTALLNCAAVEVSVAFSLTFATGEKASPPCAAAAPVEPTDAAAAAKNAKKK